MQTRSPSGLQFLAGTTHDIPAAERRLYLRYNIVVNCIVSRGARDFDTDRLLRRVDALGNFSAKNFNTF